jgi:hypothetical protein
MVATLFFMVATLIFMVATLFFMVAALIFMVGCVNLSFVWQIGGVLRVGRGQDSGYSGILSINSLNFSSPVSPNNTL